MNMCICRHSTELSSISAMCCCMTTPPDRHIHHNTSAPALLSSLTSISATLANPQRQRRCKQDTRTHLSSATSRSISATCCCVNASSPASRASLRCRRPASCPRRASSAADSGPRAASFWMVASRVATWQLAWVQVCRVRQHCCSACKCRQFSICNTPQRSTSLLTVTWHMPVVR